MTTMTALQSSTLLTILPLIAHCFARRCCQNPNPRSTTDNPRSQGRKVARNALAVLAPRAAAKPNGRQQLNETSELAIAPKDVERLQPCFTILPLAGPWQSRVGSSRRTEGPFHLCRKTSGN